jgi:trehalose 2-sulfotransferase
MTETRPIRSMSDKRLDFAHATPLRMAYLVASSPRSGSTYLCSILAQSGLLGAPAEMLNPGPDLRAFKARLKVSSHAEYIAALITLRTSRSGVFGLKAHFRNFEAFLKEYPPLLQVLSPMTYIYVYRRDGVAQAVSMVRALQTNQWLAQAEEKPKGKARLRYDRDLIAKTMKEIELADAAWVRWFEANNINPFRIVYEDLTADPARTVQSVVELLGVQNAESDEVMAPPVEKQADDTNLEWIERFRRETESEATTSESSWAETARADADSLGRAATLHFFDRNEWLIQSLPKFKSATGFLDLIRLRHRYNAIVGQNLDFFRGTQVLDIVSHSGFWSLAALDAGASNVIAVEPSQKSADNALNNLVKSETTPERFKILKSRISKALQTAEPKQFDLIMCKRYFEYCYLPEFFHQLYRLQPKYVIVDTKIALGEGALCRFSTEGKSWKGGRSAKIIGTPTHDLIEFLCGSEFKFHVVDWRGMGIDDWTGIQDYANGSDPDLKPSSPRAFHTRRTYVIEPQ